MHYFFNFFLCLMLSLSFPKILLSSEFSWIAQGSNCDLNTATNWNPNTVPGMGDIAIFDNQNPSICLSPTSGSNFTVGQLQFPNQASVFSFTFTNSTLTFKGSTVGLSGAKTDPIINIISNNASSGIFFYLQGTVNNNLGSANITINASDASNFIYQMYAPSGNPVSMGNSGSLTVKNHSQSGSSQIFFDSFTSLNNTNLKVENNNSILSGPQIQSSSFSCGDFLTFKATNYGNLTGASDTGYVQGIVQIDNFQAGNNAKFTISNIGICHSPQTGLNVGTSTSALNAGTFSAGNNLTLTVQNSGNVSSQSGGGSNNYIGYMTDSLLGCSTFNGGDFVSIIVSNEGINSGSSTSNYIGTVNADLIGLTDFIAGNDLNISITNSGFSSADCDITNISTAVNLFAISNTFNSKDRSTISISNSGSLTFNNHPVADVFIGFIDNQFLVSNNFTTGDDFQLTISNVSLNNNLHSTSVSYIGGFSVNGCQASFGSNAILGMNANIKITNKATYLGTSSDIFMSNPLNQFYVAGNFQSDKNLLISVTNSSSNPNSIATIGTATNQINFAGNCILNDGTSLIAINNQNGLVTNQMLFNGGLTVHGKVSLEANNSGVLNGLGISVQNSPGGDLNIILNNSSLSVDNTSLLQPFTIGSLVAETTSSVSANQGLIIDTDPNVNAIFNGTISTTPFLIKQGSGTQIFIGTIDPVDMSYIKAGTLILKGTFEGDLTINSEGNFSGNATVNGSVTNYGQISPNKFINVTEFTNESSGIYYSTLGKNQNSYIVHATGPVSLLGGIVQTALIDEYTFHKSYIILSSDATVSGTFASLAANELFLGYLSYDTNHVYLTLAQNLSAAAKTHNEKMVANQVDSILNPNPVQSHLINELTRLSLPQATNALASLSGKQYANTAFFTEEVSRQFIRRLYDPLRPIITCNSCSKNCCNDFTTWTEVGGDFSFIDGDSLYGYQITSGIQKHFCMDLTLGMAISYEGDFINYQNQGGTEYQNHSLVGLYALYRPQHFYVLGDIAYGYNINSMNRNIQIGSAKYKAKSIPHNSEFSLYGEIGGNFPTHKGFVQPFFGLEMDTSWRSHIHEKSNSGWQLNLYKKNHTDTFSRVGVHLSTCKISHNFWINLDLAWDCRLTNQKITTKDRFALFGDKFSIWGKKLNRNSFDYALTVANTLSKNWNVYLQTSGKIYNHATTFGVLSGFGYNW